MNALKRIVVTLLLLGSFQAARAATVIVEWDAVTQDVLGNPETVAGYRLYRSTNSLLTTTTQQANTPAFSYVSKTTILAPSTFTTVSGLSDQTSYYFRLTAYDAAGNESGFNVNDLGGEHQEIFFSTTVVDGTPPVISFVSASGVTVTGATITWTTNEPADSRVEYGPTASYGSQTPLDTARVASHSQTLDDLAPNTTYHYRVHSRDAAGNLATSGNFTLLTPVAADAQVPTAPGSHRLVAVSSFSAQVAWDASTDNVGVGGYRVSLSTVATFASHVPGYQNLSAGNVTGFTFTGLSENTTYYSRVRAFDTSGNLSAYSAVISTRTRAAPDATLPTVAITAPTGGAMVSGAAVQVTASASDNVGVVGVQFRLDGANLGAEDTTPPYAVTWNTTLAANGSRVLTAVARDAAGNTRTSVGITVTVDNAAPTFSAMAAAVTGASSARITWNTNEASNSQVEYGTTTAYGRTTAADIALVSAHTVDLTDLTGPATYYYRVRSRDAAGNQGISVGAQFYMPDVPPQITIEGGPLDTRVYMVGIPAVATARVIPGAVPMSQLQVFLEFTAPNQAAFLHSVSMHGGAGETLREGIIDVPALFGEVEGDIRYRAMVRAPGGVEVRTAERVLRLVSEVNVPRAGNGIFEIPNADPSSAGLRVYVPAPAIREMTLRRENRALAPRTGEEEIDGAFGASPIVLMDILVPGQAHTVLNTPGLLTLVYPDADDDGRVDGTSIPEDVLRVFWHDGARWRALGGQVDAERNSVTAKVTHFSRYALFPAVAGSGETKALEKFLSPATVDGRNDVATFGLEAERVTIVDAAGRVIFEASTDGSAVSWNCRDENGNIVPSGVYIAKIKQKDGKTVYQNFAVVK